MTTIVEKIQNVLWSCRRTAMPGRLTLPIVFALVAVTACQVRWVSEYDEQTDRAVTAYQQKMNTYFEQLKEKDWPECSYAASTDFYADASSDTIAILTRAQSLPKNDQTIRQAEALKDNLHEVRITHKESDADQACLSVPYVAKSQDFMNQIVRAILWLEQGKKRTFGQAELPDALTPKRE